MREIPHHPAELLGELFNIFPQYYTDYSGPIHHGLPTVQAVMQDFAVFFRVRAKTFSHAQLEKFGGLVNAAVEADGPLESAFTTYLLKHLRPIHAWTIFKPHLSELAREKARA